VTPELRDQLLAEGAVHGRTTIATFKFLFEQWLSPQGLRDIAVKDVLELCPGCSSTSGGVGTLITRLRNQLDAYYRGPGRRHQWRLQIGKDGYQPEMIENDGEAASGYLSRFWAPYLHATRPIHVIYPEPLFYIDANETYIRKPSASSVENLAPLRCRKPLKENYSFAPAGVVAGMLYLLDVFYRLRIPFRTRAVRPGMTIGDIEGGEPIVILGTPQTTHLITSLESPMDARAVNGGIRVRNGKGRPLRFDDTSKREELTGTKYALLTRREHNLRLVTILSADHGRTVQGLAGFLTNEKQLATLAAKFSPSDSFPQHLQAVFEVTMIETEAEPDIASIVPKLVR
jgi:hypothetical protein